MAKTISELIYGVSDAMIRFDMSEFGAEHTRARLIGAPPGYVGYGQSGELTEAVRSKPNSLILFDEIEKAHPSIFDLFLQILGDGRLTDSMGNTVYFNETIIVFTSNLGTVEDPACAIQTDDDSHEHEEALQKHGEYAGRFVSYIRRWFTYRLGRKEIFGRIGEKNIIVFNEMTKELAETLVPMFIENIVNNVRREHRKEVVIGEIALQQAMAISTAEPLKEGGRTIKARLEEVLVDQIAREILLNPSSERIELSSIGAQSVTAFEPIERV
jgi:ATP-dependent Clp protease ATP-binding subunit ClpA